MNTVEVVEDDTKDRHSRPFRVSVNGNLLRNAVGGERRFTTSFAAGLAGAREVDRLRDRGKTFVTGSSGNGRGSENG